MEGADTKVLPPEGGRSASGGWASHPGRIL